MICDNCNRDVTRLDHAKGKDGDTQLVCTKCKRMPLCPRCGKRKNSLTLIPNGQGAACPDCFRRIQ